MLSKLKDQDLHQTLILKVQAEKKLLTEILKLLKEVETRKLYSDFSCRSLFDYCVKILKYSEAEAYTRINAMRLIKEVPELEQSLKKGEISLTNAAQAQSFFKKEEKLKEKFKPVEKTETLENLKHKSTRQAKAFLESKTSIKSKEAEDSIKDLPNGKVEIKFSASDENFKKIEALKNRFSKAGEDLSFEELFVRLHESLKVKTAGGERSTKHAIGSAEGRTTVTAARRKSCVKKTKSVTPRIRREVFEKYQHQCRNCGSTKNLEVDHVKPQALGGKHGLDNLQALCRNCNQRRAIKSFGLRIGVKALARS